MAFFGLFGSKGVPVDAETLVKLMSAGPRDFEGLARTDDGYPENVFECGNIANTLMGKSQVLRLCPCRDEVSLVRAKIKKRQATVFYVTPLPFSLEFSWRNGGSVKVKARLKTDAASSLAEWLQANVKKPGENVKAADLGKLLDAQLGSDKPLPDWLDVLDREDIAEVKPPDPPKELSVEDLKPGVMVFDHFRIERELGGGGQGKVFLATDTQTLVEQHSKVVLKVLRCETCGDEASMQEFIKEANTLADFRDDRIVTCYWCRPLVNAPILAMEYVEGDSLDKYLADQEDGVLSEEETRELLRPIAEALDSAHERGIFHRDVKPQNIIVRKTPKRIGKKTIRTCLLDFGIASRGPADACQTSFMSVRGTLQYMSPEQQNVNSKPSAGMDVYSLAVTAYECLTGNMPYYRGFKPNETVKPIASNSPFAKSVMRGLSERLKDRPATCVELIDPPLPPLPPPSAPQPPSSAPETSPRRSPPSDDLVALKKSFEVYRQLLAQSAQRSAGNPELAEWLRTCQANLRNLTQNLAEADASALIILFKGVRERMGSARPEDFFAALDRLEELRCGLPKSGGAVWRALCDSVK